MVAKSIVGVGVGVGVAVGAAVRLLGTALTVGRLEGGGTVTVLITALTVGRLDTVLAGAATDATAAWLGSGAIGAPAPEVGPEPRVTSTMQMATPVINKTTTAITPSSAARFRRPGAGGTPIDGRVQNSTPPVRWLIASLPVTKAAPRSESNTATDHRRARHIGCNTCQPPPVQLMLAQESVSASRRIRVREVSRSSSRVIAAPSARRPNPVVVEAVAHPGPVAPSPT